MGKLEASVLINRPIEDIFAFLNTPENHARFIPGMREFKKTSPGSLGQVGARARGVRQDFGRKTEVLYEITACEPNTKLEMKGAMGPVLFEDGYALDSRGDKTLVKFWLELTLTGLSKLAQPFAFLVGKTHAAETLANLKKVLESTR
jgi:carbon monoxide dehydrogenase subunit G